MKISVNLLVLLGFILLTASFAAKSSDNFNWRGFVAQGIIQGEHSNYIDDDGDFTLKLTEVGLNGSYTLENSNFRLAGQVVYLNGGNRYPEGLRVDYLFLDWRAITNLDWQVNVHLGRVKNYHWLYSSTRDVPHTRPTIILPQSIYFDAFRDVALGVDGAAVVANTSNAWGDWEFNWSYGSSPISEEQTKNLIAPIATGDIEQKFVHQGNLVWHDQALRLSAGLLDSKFEYNSGDEDFFINGEGQIQRLILQGTYETQNWLLAVELFRERSVYSNLIFAGFNTNTQAEGGYIQGRYFINKDLALTTRLDIFDLDRNDRDGEVRAAESNGEVPAYFGFQDQFTLGVSWTFADDWQLQAEFHRVKGTGRLAPVFMPNTMQNDRKYWNIWGVQLAHWF
ncbi:TonB-dependent receptor [Aliiglaciecola sp. 3_MG-2023]|uniref:TonB-dependent receptor n=1 Tax=Aliiglaciecola sp. 3_MG-2023 TaxID=3062644 RepID=UPI0026E1A02A|nr:TonB-dependent receptor [Aliiglaciecola sp. 3_MG-2023]MDO6693016.1 TonB-dependent receptor [Aliiglaciecola sp. 3_MG-2023]